MVKSSFFKLTNLILLICFLNLCGIQKMQGQSLATDVTLPSFFGDNMVLQRDKPVKIWGWASPNSKLKVSFAGKSHEVAVDAKGKWNTQFPAQKAGVTTTLEFKGIKSLIYKNVIMGDVWICSGQSNMEFNFGRTDSIKKDSETENNIRSINVPYNVSNYPQQNFKATNWMLCNPKNALSFSGVAYYFAQRVYQKTKIPIGIINSSWGGTSIIAWTSEDGIRQIPEYQGLLKSMVNNRNTAQAIDSVYNRNKIVKKKIA